MDASTTRAVSRLEARDQLTISCTVRSSLEQLWSSVTHAPHLQDWFTEHATIDLHAGGFIQFGGCYTPGNPVEVHGIIQEIIPLTRVRFTWPMHAHPTEVTFLLTSQADRSTLEVLHSGLALPTARVGRMDLHHQMMCFWENALANLQARIEIGQSGFRLDYLSIASSLVERCIKIEASPGRVWQALTDPEELNRWVATGAAVDLRPGGTYSYGWEENGHSGYPLKVESLDPPHRLVHTWDDDGFVERVTWTLIPLREGTATRLLLQHEMHDPANGEGYRIGWPGFLNRLWWLLQTHTEQE